MYFVRIPYIIKKLFPQLIWELPNGENKVFLTFDDGPHPEITPWILEQLRIYEAKATFFCLGEHIEKYPEIVQDILKDGHAIGNHGYKHLNGWQTSDDDYLQDYLKAEEVLVGLRQLRQAQLDREQAQSDSVLFRPAYGKVKKSQILFIKSAMPASHIINWSLMPGDFDQSNTSEQCYTNLQKVKSGDIVVLHDNDKSWKHVQYCLPKLLAFLQEKKLKAAAITLT